MSNSDWYKYFIRQTCRFLKIICLIKLTLIIMLSSITVGSLLILKLFCKYWIREYTLISKMEQNIRAGVNRKSFDCWCEDSQFACCHWGCKANPLIIVAMGYFEFHFCLFAIQACFQFLNKSLAMFLIYLVIFLEKKDLIRNIIGIE